MQVQPEGCWPSDNQTMHFHLFFQPNPAFHSPNMADETFLRMSLETLEELDWCLDQLETIQTHRSVSDMASSKVWRLRKEFSSVKVLRLVLDRASNKISRDIGLCKLVEITSMEPHLDEYFDNRPQNNLTK